MKIGVTGGIGSGKSTVCRLFAERGVAVYDSDAAAKRLMVGVLRVSIEARFGAESYCGAELNRGHLASVVFADPGALADLNAIVHPAVLSDFEVWCEHQHGDYVMLESAILFESGFDSVVDKTLAILAPAEVRVGRTCLRDGVSSDVVRGRMAAQMSDDDMASRADYTFVNLFEEDIEPVVTQLDLKFRCDAKSY